MLKNDILFELIQQVINVGPYDTGRNSIFTGTPRHFQIINIE